MGGFGIQQIRIQLGLADLSQTTPIGTFFPREVGPGSQPKDKSEAKRERAHSNRDDPWRISRWFSLRPTAAHDPPPPPPPPSSGLLLGDARGTTPSGLLPGHHARQGRRTQRWRRRYSGSRGGGPRPDDEASLGRYEGYHPCILIAAERSPLPLSPPSRSRPSALRASDGAPSRRRAHTLPHARTHARTHATWRCARPCRSSRFAQLTRITAPAHPLL